MRDRQKLREVSSKISCHTLSYTELIRQQFGVSSKCCMTVNSREGFPIDDNNSSNKITWMLDTVNPSTAKACSVLVQKSNLSQTFGWRRGFMSSAHVNFQLHSQVGVSIRDSLPLWGCYDYHTTGKTPPFSPSNTHKHWASASVCRFQQKMR